MTITMIVFLLRVVGASIIVAYVIIKEELCGDGTASANKPS